jgi:hypothetical protein
MNFTIDSILEEYRDNGHAAFAIYEGKERHCIYEGKDIEEGEERLSKYLNRIEKGSVKVKIYKTIPKAGIDDKTPAYLTLPYTKQYTAEEKNQYWEGRGLGSHMMEELRNMRAEISGLKSQLEEDPETDEELEKESEPQSLIAGIVSNPAVQNMIASFLTNLSANVVSNHVTPTPAQYTRPMAMAGIPEDLETIIESLQSKGVTVSDFRKLDSMPADRLSFLLNMLRAQ